jgi:alpha-L-fucosidase
MSTAKMVSLMVAGVVLASFVCDGGAVESMPVEEPAAFLPVPNAAQLKWHKAEYRMFVHFGMKTFHPSSNHMGSGNEDPKTFNPKLFDAEQWVAAAKSGGFEGIVLTTKHHDGFCNWQTDTTDHCVRSSPWKNGKGDIVRELIEACHKNGLSFGFYVSIIDRHFEQHGSANYKFYGDFYLAQIKELSTRYGQVEEYWFDGYKSDKTKIDYKKLADIIVKNQPNAVIYDSGTLVKYMPDRCLSWPGHHGGASPDQNYRHEIDGIMRWYPNEPSIILQGNWFHNGTPIVSLDRIQNYYLTSVGYSITPLMNISPNADGLIDESTIAGLKEFKAWADELNGPGAEQNDGVKISADSVRGDAVSEYGPQNMIDGDYDTYYAVNDDVRDATIEITLAEVQKIRGFIIQEYIPLGQRVDGYTIECMVDGSWQKVFSGSKIGFKRIILAGYASAKEMSLPATDRIRLKIRNAKAAPLINTFKLIK